MPGSRLQVDALAVDPAQPDVLYVATSYLYGTTQLHGTPVGVSMSTNGAQAWSALPDSAGLAVADLLPVSGATGAILALTTDSRAPLALGNAPVAAETTVSPEAMAASSLPITVPGYVSWLVAALAAMALLFAVASDLRSRQGQPGRSLTSSMLHTVS